MKKINKNKYILYINTFDRLSKSVKNIIKNKYNKKAKTINLLMKIIITKLILYYFYYLLIIIDINIINKSITIIHKIVKKIK